MTITPAPIIRVTKEVVVSHDFGVAFVYHFGICFTSYWSWT